MLYPSVSRLPRSLLFLREGLYAVNYLIPLGKPSKYVPVRLYIAAGAAASTNIGNGWGTPCPRSFVHPVQGVG